MELSQVAYEAEVDFICSKIKHNVDGRNLFHSAREEMVKVLD